MGGITKEKNVNRKKDRINLLVLIALIVALVGGIPGLINTWDYFYNAPDLEIIPFQKNDTLYFHIYNKGDKSALITEYILFYCKDGNNCYKDRTTTYGKPLEIPCGKSTIISTGYNIQTLKSENSANKWGVSICEKSIGCPNYIFYGEPSEEFVVSRPGITGEVGIEVLPRNETKNISE